MIPQRCLVSLLLATGIHGMVVQRAPDGTGEYAGTNLNIDEISLSEEAAGTTEGKDRISSVKELMKQVAKKNLPNADIHWDEVGIGRHGCFFARYPIREADSDQVNVRIRATDIDDLDSGDELTIEEIITKVTSSVKTHTSATSNSDQEKKAWEAGGKLSLGPLSGVTIGGSVKYGNAETTIQESTTSFTNKASEDDQIQRTLRDTLVCESGHYCRVQLWTYDITFKGSAPLVPMVRPQCIVEWQMTDRSRNSPGRLYEGVLEQLYRRGIWWYNGLESGVFEKNPDGDDTRHLPDDTTPLRSYTGYWRGLGFGWGPSGNGANRLDGKAIQTSSLNGNMDWWDEENSKYYNVTRNDGSAAKLPDVPFPVGDNLQSWLTTPGQAAWKGWEWDGSKWNAQYEPEWSKVPIGPQDARGVKLPRWEWTGRDSGSYDGAYNVDFSRSKAWAMDFPARNADGSIMSTVAIIKTPYDDANKKRADDATLTIQILQENINLNFADYS
ncbi:hypothetical protein MY11210_002307 [Beauveria gryllotalpidicola]